MARLVGEDAFDRRHVKAASAWSEDSIEIESDQDVSRDPAQTPPCFRIEENARKRRIARGCR